MEIREIITYGDIMNPCELSVRIKPSQDVEAVISGDYDGFYNIFNLLFSNDDDLSKVAHCALADYWVKNGIEEERMNALKDTIEIYSKEK